MTEDGPPPAGRPPRTPGRRLVVAGGAAVVLVVVLLALARGDGGSPADRRGAEGAWRALQAVTARPDSTSAELCDAVAAGTRRSLAALAAFLPVPARGCPDVPARLLRVALAPRPPVRGGLRARVDGDRAVVDDASTGREMGRATEGDGEWRADPAAGGPGAWRLRTAATCSRALTAARLTPLTADPAGFRRAVTVRLRGVEGVLALLRPDRVPTELRTGVGAPRDSLLQLRDALRGGLRATGAADDLAGHAPDAAELPSILQVVQSFAALRVVGAPCLGGPVTPSAAAAADRACRAERLPIDTGYKVAGRAGTAAGVASGFARLGASWARIAAAAADLDTSAAPRLERVGAAAAASARRAASLADALAARARDGRATGDGADALDLAQRSALDALLGLGARDCAAIS